MLHTDISGLDDTLAKKGFTFEKVDELVMKYKKNSNRLEFLATPKELVYTFAERGFFLKINSELTAQNYQLINGEELITVQGKSTKAAGGSGSGSGSGSGACPQGTWYSPACGDPHGVVWKFGADKKGSFSNKDCNGICGPMIFAFSYTMSGTTCSITYDALQPYVKCTGYPDTRPPKPSDASITLSCSSAGLTVTSGSGTITFTKQ